jgi:hypothetical protein
MRKSQPDGTRPLPNTAELGAEGGSFGDSASRQSRETNGGAEPAPDDAATDIVGNVTRLPDMKPDVTSDASKDVKKYPTET